MYTPKVIEGECEAGAKSRRLVRAIKNETHMASVRWGLAKYLEEHLSVETKEKFFGADTTLVPMPGHAPLKDQSSRWPSRVLCEQFVGQGLGRNWLPLLARTKPVAKSSFVPSDQRPDAQTHFESLSCALQEGVGERITVVDDVITRGATLLAAVGALKAVYPAKQVQGFALIRTMSGIAIERVVDPVEGIVFLNGGQTARRP